MKIGGKKIDSRPASETLYFPRGEDVVAIRANAVMDRTDFDRYCPLPKAPQKRIKGGILVDNFDDIRHIAAVNRHGTSFINWLIIKSLCSVDKETQGDIPIEWELVSLTDSSTWSKWDEELKESGFSDMERKRVHNLVINVNSLSDARLDEARKSFLLPVEKEVDQSSFPLTEQSDTPSGEPVNESESVHQDSQNAGTTLTK